VTGKTQKGKVDYWGCVQIGKESVLYEEFKSI